MTPPPEQDRRRFDTGSGISVELLPESILEFVFHDLVLVKILKNFSGTSPVYDANARNIYWYMKDGRPTGIAGKGESDELIIIGASATDIKDVAAFLKDSEVMSVINNVHQAWQDDTVSAEELAKYPVAEIQNGAINSAISQIGPKLKIVTIRNWGFSMVEEFIDTHLPKGNMPPLNRIFTPYTKGTGQGKYIAWSYATGHGKSKLNDNHPGRIEHKAAWISNQSFTGPFGKSKMLQRIWREANG